MSICVLIASGGGGGVHVSLDPLCPINITPCSQKCLSLFPRFVCLFYLSIHSRKFGKLVKIYLQVVVWLRFYCSICRDEEVTSHLLAYCTLVHFAGGLPFLHSLSHTVEEPQSNHDLWVRFTASLSISAPKVITHLGSPKCYRWILEAWGLERPFFPVFLPAFFGYQSFPSAFVGTRDCRWCLNVRAMVIFLAHGAHK